MTDEIDVGKIVLKEASLESTRRELVRLTPDSVIDFPLSSFELEPSTEGYADFVWNGRRYPMSLEAFTSLGQALKIPSSCTGKFPPSIMLPLFRYQISQMDGNQFGGALLWGDQFLRFRKGIEAVPVLEVFDALAEELRGKDVSVHHATFSPDFVRYSITVTESERAVVSVDDGIRFGVTVSSSTTRVSPLEIASYTHRLACTNGAVSQIVNRRYRNVADPDLRREWVRLSINDALIAFDDEAGRVLDMASMDLGVHLSGFLQSGFANFGIPISMRDAILDKAIQAPPATVYDFYNIITDLASNDADVVNNPSLSAKLMAAAGKVAAHSVEICNACGRAG